MNDHLFSARHIAEILAAPGEAVRYPTEEQRRVIEDVLEGSTLVVAGAGSGKTETIANRVVWLIANGLANPSNILGLTFTRKAAGELADRVRRRIQEFLLASVAAPHYARLTPLQRERVEELHERQESGFLSPEIQTYNSFAVGIIQEFGSLAGIPTDTVLLDDAMAWALAREVVAESSDPELHTTETGFTSLVDRVLKLDHAVNEHLATFTHVERVAHSVQRIGSLPYNDSERSAPTGRVYSDVRDLLEAVGETPLISRLAAEYAAEKRARGFLEYSDQVALALHLVTNTQACAREIRARTHALLLDEVQDTSVGQNELLSALFSGNPVMAVGDPHQSIYGWRGASSASLSDFHRRFGKAKETSCNRTMTLSTSWRNAEEILRAANELAAPLRASPSVPVPTLQPRGDAAKGAIEGRYLETLQEETEYVATWIEQRRTAFVNRTGEEASVGVLFRNRAHMGRFSRELTRRGIPNQIVGVGGLLTTPEVTEIVSTMRCLWYADAGSDLIRLLMSPRFMISVPDIRGLRAAAKWFSGRDHTQKKIRKEEIATLGLLSHRDTDFTLIDTLDKLGDLEPDHPAWRSITADGEARLREASAMLRDLRALIGGSLTDLITAISHSLRLDIELESNERSTAAGTASAQANILRFIEVAEDFRSARRDSDLRTLLEWLERSSRDDQHVEFVPEPKPGTVQLITVHGAKGLEWDIVAVPRLVAGEFPGNNKEAKGWLRAGRLPDECRGDRHARPVLRWELAETQAEFRERFNRYRAENDESHAEEERRLAYVAVTRARDELLLTGAFWTTAKRPRLPSQYLKELAAADMILPISGESRYESHPKEGEEETLSWPIPPLGKREEAVKRSARTVLRLLESAHEKSEPFQSVDPRAELLIRELNEPATESTDSLPERINASAFHSYLDDPQQVTRSRLRPIPEQPYRNTRIGNLFHEWVEQRATTHHGTLLPFANLDVEVATDVPAGVSNSLTPEEFEKLDQLKETFERSRWATLQPIAVEEEISIPFAGSRIVCKLDAVYERDDRIEIVDWKTGASPKTPAELDERFLQLDLYRIAYASHSGAPIDQIDVALFFVADNLILEGREPRSLETLEQLWNQRISNRRLH